MNAAEQNSSDPASPVDTADRDRVLRLWPGFVIVGVQWVIMLGPQLAAQFAIEPTTATPQTVESTLLDNPQTVLNSKLLGPAVGTLLLMLWWLTASRAPWKARLFAPVAITGLAWLTWKILDPTMMFAFFMFMIPSATTTGVLALSVFRKRSFRVRSWLSLALVAVAFAGWAQYRMTGVDGDLRSSFALRWVKTPEERFLESTQIDQRADLRTHQRVGHGDQQSAMAARETRITLSPQDSPAFRGVHRDGVIRGQSIRCDWPTTGLPERWRQRIGPGWSSFSAVGNWIFTQEQRGEQEVVSAYAADSGQQQWIQTSDQRFTETISGAGPRATPTWADGRLYTLGAMGTLQCLEATTGTVLWQSDLVSDTGAVVPMWGFSSSPLVVDGRVIVFAGGGKNAALIAYDDQSGEPVWQSGNGTLSYSSPQLETLWGEPQVLMMTERGLASYRPTDGELLWSHEWRLGGGAARIVQPKRVGNDIILGTGYGLGTRRLSVIRDGDQWSTTELWTSLALKPYFNDFVILDEHIYGFDRNIFTCVDLATGKRVWKRGRYGHGQVLLIEEDGVLLLVTESGELVLLQASPAGLEERHRFQALEGKTWTCPVVANGRLFVRNGVEVACYDIRPSADTTSENHQAGLISE